MNKTTIRVNGVEYTIKGEESPEYMQKIALYIDSKIAEIAFANGRLNTSMVAMLATINIADDYFKSVDSEDNLRTQVTGYIDQAGKDISEIKTLKADNEYLKEKVQSLEIKIASREAELAELRRRTNI